MSETEKRERGMADWIGAGPLEAGAHDLDLGLWLWLTDSGERPRLPGPRSGTAAAPAPMPGRIEARVMLPRQRGAAASESALSRTPRANA